MLAKINQINWNMITSIGTIGAVVVSLYLANRGNKERYKIDFIIRGKDGIKESKVYNSSEDTYNNVENNSSEYTISIYNKGNRKVRIENVGFLKYKNAYIDKENKRKIFIKLLFLIKYRIFKDNSFICFLSNDKKERLLGTRCIVNPNEEYFEHNETIDERSMDYFINYRKYVMVLIDYRRNIYFSK